MQCFLKIDQHLQMLLTLARELCDHTQLNVEERCYAFDLYVRQKILDKFSDSPIWLLIKTHADAVIKS